MDDYLIKDYREQEKKDKVLYRDRENKKPKEEKCKEFLVRIIVLLNILKD